MKAFQTLLFLAIIILIGGMAALYWGKSVQDATVPIEIVDEPTEPVEEELASGTYLIFESSVVSDPGTEARANDDTKTYTYYRLRVDEIGTAQPQSFVEIVHPASVAGGLTVDVYGQDLLLHRYQNDSQDAILSLTGEILSTSDENWDRFRSQNGRYEVTHTFINDIADTDSGNLRVEDLMTGEVREAEYAFEDVELGWPVPYLISNDGQSVAFHQQCDCGAPSLTQLWQVNVTTREIIALHELYDSEEWTRNTFDVETGRLLAITSDQEQRENDMGPYPHPIPPTTIQILKLETEEPLSRIVDTEYAWSAPRVDPQGKDRYIVDRDFATYEHYLVDFDDSEITDEHYLTDGWIRDWVGDWVVVEDPDDSTLKLVNVETKEEVLLEIPGERVEYVGSVELK